MNNKRKAAPWKDQAAPQKKIFQDIVFWSPKDDDEDEIQDWSWPFTDSDDEDSSRVSKPSKQRLRERRTRTPQQPLRTSRAVMTASRNWDDRAIVKQWVALNDYPATNGKELSFKQGDTFKNVTDEDDGWKQGTLVRTNKVGLLPSSYVSEHDIPIDGI